VGNCVVISGGEVRPVDSKYSPAVSRFVSRGTSSSRVLRDCCVCPCCGFVLLLCCLQSGSPYEIALSVRSQVELAGDQASNGKGGGEG